MSEQLWLTTSDLRVLVGLRVPITLRRLQLIGCSCCRRICECLTSSTLRQALLTAEAFADGLATRNDLRDSEKAAEKVLAAALVEARAQLPKETAGFEAHDEFVASSHAIVILTREVLKRRDLVWVLDRAVDAVGLRAIQGSDTNEVYAAYEAARRRERTEQVALVRHILGNPFRPYPASSSWPLPIVQIASALYDGQDCSFALHDALLEAGHPELAEHFQEKEHPKGCWALDEILGKK